MSSVTRWVALASLLLGAWATNAFAQCPRYEVTATIVGPSAGPMGPAFVFVKGLSNDGFVAGYYRFPLANPRAFAWYGHDPLFTLPMPDGATLSRAADICTGGWTTGVFNVLDDGNADLGFLHDRAKTIPIGVLPGANRSVARGINDRKQIVGYSDDSIDGEPPAQAFIWSDGEMVDLGPDLDAAASWALAINNRGQVVGWRRLEQQGPRIAFLWDRGAVTELGVLPGGDETIARAINERGDVVGWASRAIEGEQDVEVRPFVWRDGKMTGLGALPGYPDSEARDINDAGVIVGACWGPGRSAAVVWYDAVLYDLNDLISSEAGLELMTAEAVNQKGQIAGDARNAAGDHVGYLLTVTAPVRGDATCDGLVGFDDVLTVLSKWGPCQRCNADLNLDGLVDGNDLRVVLENWM